MENGIKPTTRYRKKDDSKKLSKRRAYDFQRQPSGRDGAQAGGRESIWDDGAQLHQPWPRFYPQFDLVSTPSNTSFDESDPGFEQAHQDASLHYTMNRPPSPPSSFEELVYQTNALQYFGRKPMAGSTEPWYQHNEAAQAIALEAASNNVEQYQSRSTCFC